MKKRLQTQLSIQKVSTILSALPSIQKQRVSNEFYSWLRKTSEKVPVRTCPCFVVSIAIGQMTIRLVLLLSTFSALSTCGLADRSHPYLENNVGSRTLLGRSKGVYFDSIPSSFAILINLGLNGRFRNLYSSNSHNSMCDAKHQIWDPFSRQCRQLYCKDHYEIRDLKCVSDNKANSTEEKTKPFIKFLDAKSTFVNVTLGIRTTRTISKQWITTNEVSFAWQFSRQFAAAWTIDPRRIINATVQYSSRQSANVNFLIQDQNDTNNDDIISSLSEEVIHRHQKYRILGRTFTAVSIHTTLAEMTDFCLKETDMPIWYWNSDFTIISKENLTMIYVNKTGRIYYPGEYIGSVLCLEEIDERGLTRVNVSSNAVVCESQTLIDETCPRILLNRSEYEFVNGRHLYSDFRFFGKYELTDNQSVFVCAPEPAKRQELEEESIDKRIESILSTSLMVISILMLGATLLTMARKSARASQNGFNSLNLVACLAVMQITFLGNQFVVQCRIPAVLFHYFILSTISWSSVIAFDMHRVLVGGSQGGRPRNKRRRLYLAYLLPAALVIFVNLCDIFDIHSIKGDYGSVLKSCWMRNKVGVLLYFIVPSNLCVLFNFILYIRIIVSIRKEIKNFTCLKKVTRIPSSSSTTSTISVISSCESADSGIGFNQTSIFARLGAVLGFTWVIALFSTIVPSQYVAVIRVLSYLFIIANTSQGVTLFLAFGVYKQLLPRK